MILVLLGTQQHSFHRLLEKLDELTKNGTIADKVIVQCGHSRFYSNHMEFLDFISIERFNDLIEKADLIISHGGVGSIINCIKSGKKVIAVPRLQKYNEHVNDHQVQIIKTFDEQGYLKGVWDINDLQETLENIKNFTPRSYISNNKNMLDLISNYIDHN